MTRSPFTSRHAQNLTALPLTVFNGLCGAFNARALNARSLQSYLLLPLLALSLAAISGCAAGDGDDDDNDGGGGGSSTGNQSQFVLTTDDNGTASTTFNVPGGTTKLQVIAEANGRNIRIDQLSDGRDVDYLSPGGEQLSLADEFAPDINAADAPSRSADPDIESGEDFQVRMTVANGNGSPVSGQDIKVDIVAKSDRDLSGGTLRVNIYYVGSIGNDPDFKSAARAAFDNFRNIYGAAGIGLNIVETEADGPAAVPSPFDGSSFYGSLSGLGGSTPAVNIVIAGDIDGFEGLAFGISGGIPGPVLPSTHSAVVVSMLTSAGADGVFNNEEIRILSETMAHEAGHFLGLFHPVDFSGQIVADSDPLSDTPTCSTSSDCVSNGSLIRNLMYTTPISNGQGGFFEQNQLSGQQQGVLNRSVAVD